MFVAQTCRAAEERSPSVVDSAIFDAELLLLARFVVPT